MIGEVIDERYVIRASVGAGGMGDVFRAYDRLTDQDVALKVLQRAGSVSLSKISHEAQALAMLRAPGVVRYIGHGLTPGGAPYLAMQWLEGETLEERLTRGPLSMLDAQALLRRVGEVLSAVHAMGLVHRDLKPANIVLIHGRVEEATLIDFGIALDAGPARLEKPRAGAIAGTPGYMAPEQVQGFSDMDARADVFALGCILYECLAGQPAFSAGDLWSLLARVVLEEPPCLAELRPDVPAWLEALCARMLAKRREDRPRDGGEVLVLLGCEPGNEHRNTPPDGRTLDALSAGERPRLSLILVQERAPTEDETWQMTLGEAENQALVEALSRGLEPLGARLALVQAQWMLIVLSEADGPGDLAVRALRSALLVREKLARAAIIVVTGRAEVAGRLPVGELIERVVGYSSQKIGGYPRGIRVDEVTAGLCGGRFVVEREGERWWLKGEARAWYGEKAPLLLGREIPCVGREREIAILAGELLRCLRREQRAGGAIVSGAMGLGKSRLMHETIRAAGSEIEGAELWMARGDPMGAGSAFGLASQALRRVIGLREGEPREDQIRKLEERVNVHPELASKRVAMFLGEILGIPYLDEGDVQLGAARRNAVLMGDRIREAWEEFLYAECMRHPVLLVLEDVHWGDVPTLNLVAAGWRHAKELPFFVLALGRPEMHALFPGLWEEHGPYRLELEPLDREAGEALVREALGERVDSARTALMLERAEGNAFFLEEQIRAVEAGKGDRLPETVISAVQGRLEAFSGEMRRVLRAASVFGETCWRGGVERLLGGEGVSDAMNWLVEKEVVVRQGAGRIQGEEEYRFRHSLLREAAYGLLTERDKRVGHGVAGQWLEEVGEIDAQVLAEHFALGGMPAKAYAMWLRAAWEALRGNDLRAAVERGEWGVQCGPDREILGLLRRVQAEAHMWLGEYALAEERGLEAMERLGAGSEGWFEAAIQVMFALERRGAVERLEVLVRCVLDTPASPTACEQKRMALADGTTTLLMNGRPVLGGVILAHLPSSVERAVRRSEAEARYFQAKSAWLGFGGHKLEALRNAELCVAAFERAGDQRNASAARMGAASLQVDTGRYEEAIENLRITQCTAQRLSLDEIYASCTINLGLALACVGHAEEGVRLEEEAIHTFRRMRSPRLELGASVYLGRIMLLLQNKPEAAESRLRSAVELSRDIGSLYPYALALHAAALLALGRATEALSEAREAFVALETQGGVEEGEFLIRLTYAETLIANHEPEPASRILSGARADLLARAQSIQTPKHRDQYLNAVPEHARILELARALSDKPSS